MSRANPRFRRAANPLPAPTHNVYEVKVLGLLDNQQWITTLYYQDAAALGSSVNEAALTAAVQSGFSLWTAVIGSDCTITGTIVTSLTSPLRASFESNLSIVLSGTTASPSHGTVSAITIDRETGIRGQSGRGWVNLAGVPTSFVGSGGYLLGATGLVPLAAWAAGNLTSTITASSITFTPVLWSRGNRTQSPKLVGVAPITSFVIRPILGTVRRRKVGRGA